MRKVSAVLLTVIMAAGLLVGCKSGDSSEGGSADNGKMKIMVASSDMSQSFYSWLANSTAEEFSKKYPDAEVTITDCAGDPSNVINFLEQAVTDKYKGVIMDKPDHEQDTKELVEACEEAGCHVIFTNNTEVEDGIAQGVGLDNYPLGFTIGGVAAEKLPKNAKVLIVESTAGNQGCIDRTQGFLDAIKDAGRDDVEILDQQAAGDWSKEKAMTVMEDFLQKYDKFDAVYSLCDDMTCGCIEACANAGLDTKAIQFYGVDGLGNGCLSVKDGDMTATVLQNADDIAAKAVELWAGMEDGSITDSKNYALDPTIITSDNVDEIIAMHKENGMMD